MKEYMKNITLVCIAILLGAIIFDALPYSSEKYGTLADWMGGIGTVAAVVVALFFNYYGILRQDADSLRKELKEFTNKLDQEQEKRMTLLENLAECLKFISNDKNDLVSKKEYLKAIIPTLKETRKDLLNDPLTQYKTNKIIEKINNNNLLDEKTILDAVCKIKLEK
ncbi:hypothetical protein CP369_07395 [Lactobacillus sp. UMNPBX18]|nr:hypothetical protein CP369_07395 [Lactobacillus sp. UMNPBX18]